MKKYYLMSDDYSCAFHDVRIYLKTNMLNPIDKRNVEDEIYAMMQENDLRHVPLSTLFPQGVETFCEESIAYTSRKTWWQILLKALAIFFIGVLLVAFAEYVASFSPEGSLIPPKVFFFPMYMSIFAIGYFTIYFLYTYIWQKYSIKKKCEGYKRWLYILPLTLLNILYLLLIPKVLMMENEIEIHLPYLPVVFIAIAAEVIIYKGLRKSYQNSFKQYVYKKKEEE